MYKNLNLKLKNVILENILKEEAGEGILVLEDFRETVSRAEKISQEDILRESQTLAANRSFRCYWFYKNTSKNAYKSINWLELILALGTIFIIYGFKRITTKVPSTLVALVVMSGIAYGFSLDYYPIKEIPSRFSNSELRNL